VEGLGCSSWFVVDLLAFKDASSHVSLHTDCKYEPISMKSGHNSNIFCISFDPTQKRIFSGGNDELVIVHCIETREAIDVVSHMDDIYGR